MSKTIVLLASAVVLALAVGCTTSGSQTQPAGPAPQPQAPARQGTVTLVGSVDVKGGQRFAIKQAGTVDQPIATVNDVHLNLSGPVGLDFSLDLALTGAVSDRTSQAFTISNLRFDTPYLLKAWATVQTGGTADGNGINTGMTNYANVAFPTNFPFAAQAGYELDGFLSDNSGGAVGTGGVFASNRGEISITTPSSLTGADQTITLGTISVELADVLYSGTAGATAVGVTGGVFATPVPGESIGAP